MRALLLRVGLAVLLVMSLALIVNCAPGSDATGGVLRVGEEAAGTTVNLHVGETVEVALPGNPTTGFDWGGARSSDVITLVRDSNESTAGPGIVGAGGVHTFVFKATSAGQDTVQLFYARPWETGVEPEKIFELHVTVN